MDTSLRKLPIKTFWASADMFLSSSTRSLDWQLRREEHRDRVRHLRNSHGPCSVSDEIRVRLTSCHWRRRCRYRRCRYRRCRYRRRRRHYIHNIIDLVTTQNDTIYGLQSIFDCL